VFEGVEKAARALEEEVLKGLGDESTLKEQALRKAAKIASRRKSDIASQLAARKKEVDAMQQVLIKAVTDRCDELRATLEAVAAEKAAAIEAQEAGLEKGADALQEARKQAKATLSSLVVEERPLQVVGACLRLKQELAAINQASQAKAPVREANLHTAFGTLDALVGEVGQFGWAGALDVDPTKCSLSQQGHDLFVEPGGRLDILLTTRDKLRQRLIVGGLPVTARVEPRTSVDGQVSVEDMGNGSYVISVQSQQVNPAQAPSLRVEVNGMAIAGSPFALVSFPSSIVTTQEHFVALHGFVPGRRLELCYQASRDGWTAADFHRLCDGKGPTVVVAKEEGKGYIFGGSWGAYNRDVEDQQAFLFSIRNPASVGPIKIPWRTNNLYSAVYHDSDSGPMFGKHGDLTLLVRKRPQFGTSKLGRAYAPLADVPQPLTFLAGARSFRLSELEVFLVK
jgi:hypothetical protein